MSQITVFGCKNCGRGIFFVVSYFFQKTTWKFLCFLSNLRIFCLIQGGVCRKVEIVTCEKQELLILVWSHFKPFTHFCRKLANVANYSFWLQKLWSRNLFDEFHVWFQCELIISEDSPAVAFWPDRGCSRLSCLLVSSTLLVNSTCLEF